jgi:hypothetical protein
MTSLSLEQRERIKAALVGLTGNERHRERMRLRSRLLRECEDYRKADNAKKAAHGREAYHADLEQSRRRGAEKCRRRRALSRPTPTADQVSWTPRASREATASAGPSKATDEAKGDEHEG